jgi:hypothetical protein
MCVLGIPVETWEYLLKPGDFTAVRFFFPKIGGFEFTWAYGPPIDMKIG